jgi:hypothetical protein
VLMFIGVLKWLWKQSTANLSLYEIPVKQGIYREKEPKLDPARGLTYAESGLLAWFYDDRGRELLRGEQGIHLPEQGVQKRITANRGKRRVVARCSHLRSEETLQPVHARGETPLKQHRRTPSATPSKGPITSIFGQAKALSLPPNGLTPDSDDGAVEWYSTAKRWRLISAHLAERAALVRC